MEKISKFVTAKKTSWLILVLAIVATGIIFTLGSGISGETAPGSSLPKSAQSQQVAQLQKDLPGKNSTSAIFVFSSDKNTLSDSDLNSINAKTTVLAKYSQTGIVPPAQLAEDRKAAIIVVPLEVENDVKKQADRAEMLRTIANEDLPVGVQALLSGPEGFAVDIAAVFAGANVKLLLTTIIVVAILLVVTYRSPWLWLVPLVVVGLADSIAGVVAARVASLFAIELDASITGILSVLVFGAGTNYALLLIARYRDELRKFADRRTAMSKALQAAGPAIIASGSTVALSLLTLLFAELTGNRALGIACATGIVVAMIFVLFLLPAALVLFSRKIFWPYVPKYKSVGNEHKSLWFNLGTNVAKKPLFVVIVGFLFLGGLAIGGVPHIKVGLSQTEQFTKVPEAVLGQQIIANSFPAGSGSPAVVITNSGYVQEILAKTESLPEVASAKIGETNGTITEINVVLTSAAETPQAFTAIENLRTTLNDVAGADALVGGLDAQTLDEKVLQKRDQDLVIPIILIIVFCVLVILLRALVAPLLLLITVVGSFFASLGASWVIFRLVFDFPAMDTNVVLFSFLFLVSLGVDYNIFLVTRAREETVGHGTKTGMIRALYSTGGVITSAGILLSAVFAVLGVLPLITLTQIGIIVCIGVLLDTLLVRTVIVPALAFIAGDKFWWPNKIS